MILTSPLLLPGLLLLLVAACSTGQPAAEDQPQPNRVTLSATVPVLFGIEVSPENASEEQGAAIQFVPNKRGTPSPRLTHVRLFISGIPAEHEGSSYTLIGGGLDGLGLHGPESTGFEGMGYHFAQSEERSAENVLRDDAYEQDYTRRVKDGSLQFDLFYEPSDINQWGERYFPGCEVALTMMKAGTEQRVLHAGNNIYNWAIAGAGAGRSADISISLQQE